MFGVRCWMLVFGFRRSGRCPQRQGHEIFTGLDYRFKGISDETIKRVDERVE